MTGDRRRRRDIERVDAGPHRNCRGELGGVADDRPKILVVDEPPAAAFPAGLPAHVLVECTQTTPRLISLWTSPYLLVVAMTIVHLIECAADISA